MKQTYLTRYLVIQCAHTDGFEHKIDLYSSVKLNKGEGKEGEGEGREGRGRGGKAIRSIVPFVYEYIHSIHKCVYLICKICRFGRGRGGGAIVHGGYNVCNCTIGTIVICKICKYRRRNVFIYFPRVTTISQMFRYLASCKSLIFISKLFPLLPCK